MSQDRKSAEVAVVCEKDGEQAAAMQAYLQSEDLTDSRWYRPPDVDDVDEAVRAGRIGHVVFCDLTGLLDAIWDEDIQFDEWLSAGVAVSFADSAGAASDSATAAAVYESWRKWQRRQKHRRLVAGAILSVIVLVAGFALTL